MKKVSWAVIVVLIGLVMVACNSQATTSNDPVEFMLEPNTITVEIAEKQAQDLTVAYEWVPSRRHVSILSVGDIMAHKVQLDTAWSQEGYDFTDQFAAIAPVIQSRDFAIGNIETVFAGEAARYSGANMIFNSPDSLAEAVKEAGFDILTTANNHSLDRGYLGIERTIEVLKALDLKYTGTARTQEEADQILTFEEDGISFALLSYSYSTNGWPMPTGHPYALNMIDDDKIVEDIKRARALGVDFVLVAPHWGLEYHLDENIHQQRLTEKMFFAGADIVLGSHPHVIQPFEHKKMVDASGQERDKFIIYSQGNFISGQMTYPRAIGMHITFDFLKINDGQAYVDEVSVMPTYVEYKKVNNIRHMRILDTSKAVEAYEAGQLDISEGLARDLTTYKEDFVAHIASKSDFEPYLNDRGDYVIYKKEN